MQTIENKGNIIGEFDLYDYGLPTTKGFLFHQLSNGGNDGEKYPHNREYLRIIGFLDDGSIVEYGYIYFMLYTDTEGLKISSYIGSKVDENFRNKGLGDLLMTVYLYYSYDNGYNSVESTTRQRKLDLLSLMNKYGFEVENPALYDNGERITIYKNRMVVDIYKVLKDGIYYQFKTKKAEEIYRRVNAKISGGYRYLEALDQSNIGINGIKLGWIVPGEHYVLSNQAESKKILIASNLKKSGFSR